MTRPDPGPGAAAPATANLSPLAAEALRILQAEVDHPPLTAESLANVLNAIGFGLGRVPVVEIEGALAELASAGHVERIWRRGVAHYRAFASKQSVAGAA
jgi:hypothetical protein